MPNSFASSLTDLGSLRARRIRALSNSAVRASFMTARRSPGHFAVSVPGFEQVTLAAEGDPEPEDR